MNSIADKLDLSHSQIRTMQQKESINSVSTENLDEVKKLSEEFESIFLGIVLKSMRDTVPKSGFVKEGNGEEIFRSMLDTEYAKSLASQRSTGLADSIERHLLGLMDQKAGSNQNLTSNLTGINRYKDQSP